MRGDLPPWIDGGADGGTSRSASRGARHPRLRPGGRRGGGRPWAVAAAAVLVLCAVVLTVRSGAAHERGAVRAVHLLRRMHLLPGGRAVKPPAAAATTSAPPSRPSMPPAAYTPANPPPAWAGPLPYPLLITDAGTGRIVEVAPGGQVVWQYPAAASPVLGPAAASASTAPGSSATSAPAATGSAAVALAPTDGSFTPDGSGVVVASERQDVVARINYATHVVTWRFGVAGQAGADATHLDYPDDAFQLPDGTIIAADIRNCREVFLNAAGQMAAEWGAPQTGYCATKLSANASAKDLFGYPNGDEPQPDGSILFSFSADDRIALLSSAGKVLWDLAAPNLYGGFVSDAALLPGGYVLVCGYGDPGSVVRFGPVRTVGGKTVTGGVVWHYFASAGSGALARPTDAVQLPNGDIAVADSGHGRVVVIDPTTNAVVWSYHTGLQDPEGIAVDYFRDWRTALHAG